MKFEYSSNNSGGVWWLSDDNWADLEKAGWEVEWTDERWFGALATAASKEFETFRDCIEDFEKVTGQDASDEGCNCCGPPHCFSWDGGYASGEGVLAELYGDVPTKRQLMEKLRR